MQAAVGRTLLCLVAASYAHAQMLQVTSFTNYDSNTTGVVAGALYITPIMVNGTLQHKLTWELTGTDDACDNETESGNVCGIHFHIGRGCADESTIGGHLHSKDIADPWTTVQYTSAAGVSTEVVGQSVETGLTTGDLVKRVVVVHNSVGAGERIACGIATFAPTTTTTVTMPAAATTSFLQAAQAQLSLACGFKH